MKTITVIALCTAMLLTGCAATGGAVQIPNPMVEKSSIEEINSAAGTDIQRPLAFSISNEKYFVINTDVPVADYRFTIDGIEYVLRAANTMEDISGVYDDAPCLTHWYHGEIQYSLYSGDGDAATMRSIAADQSPVFYPVVDSVADDYMTVIPNEDTPERRSSDIITLPLQYVEGAEPAPGDVVEIAYNGEIMESYPAQLGQVYRIQVMLPVG